jgi:hypothetical protein
MVLAAVAPLALVSLAGLAAALAVSALAGYRCPCS